MDHLRVAVILERRKGSVHPRPYVCLIPEFYETSLDVVLSSLGVRLSFVTFLMSWYPLNGIFDEFKFLSNHNTVEIRLD